MPRLLDISERLVDGRGLPPVRDAPPPQRPQVVYTHGAAPVKPPRARVPAGPPPISSTSTTFVKPTPARAPPPAPPPPPHPSTARRSSRRRSRRSRASSRRRGCCGRSRSCGAAPRRRRPGARRRSRRLRTPRRSCGGGACAVFVSLDVWFGRVDGARDADAVRCYCPVLSIRPRRWRSRAPCEARFASEREQSNATRDGTPGTRTNNGRVLLSSALPRQHCVGPCAFAPRPGAGAAHSARPLDCLRATRA